MGTRWALAPPQGKWSLSTAATGFFTERWQLGLQGLLPGLEVLLRLTLGVGRGGSRSHLGCLCLWGTANSGFQMMPKLPGLWVQIRNLQHLAEDRTELGSNAWAKESFLFLWLVAATLAMANPSAYSGQTIDGLDRTGHGLIHNTDVLPTWPHPSSLQCRPHEPGCGRGCAEQPGSFPQPSRALHHQAAGWISWLVPACLPLSIASTGQE